MSEVGPIKNDDFQEIIRFHDRQVKRWRERGIVHKRPVYGDWVVVR